MHAGLVYYSDEMVNFNLKKSERFKIQQKLKLKWCIDQTKNVKTSFNHLFNVFLAMTFQL